MKRAAKRKQKFKGIIADAALLGVNRIHLWKVLVGDRESKPLLMRWKELKRKQKAARLAISV